MKTRQKQAREAACATTSENPLASTTPPVAAIPSPQTPPQRQLLREAEVCARLRRHRSSVWRDVKSGAMPSPVRLGRSVLWYADEIDSFVANLRRTTASE